MASSVSVEKLRSCMAHRTYVHDPADATVATKIDWVSMRDFENFLASATLVSGTGILTFKIFGAEDSSGTNAAIIVSHSDPTTVDAAGDMVVLECSNEQLKEVDADFDFVSAEIDCDASGDIVAVSYCRCNPKRAYSGLTADVIS